MSTPPFVRLPATVSHHIIGTPRGSFAVLENAGKTTTDGTALLVPGFTGSKEDFIALLEPLADHGVSAVAIDLTGQYETPGSSDVSFRYALADYAADVLSVVHLLRKPVHLVGHSFGGLVAREVVLADPLAIASLTLLDSGPAAIPPEQQPLMRLFAQVLASNGLAAVWAAKQALEEEEGVHGPDDAEVAQFLTKRFLANSPASLLSMVDILCECEDRTQELAAVAPPTLVCFGADDDVWLPAEQEAMARQLSAQISSLPGTGHSPAAQAPKQLADALVRFWRDAQIESGSPSQG